VARPTTVLVADDQASSRETTARLLRDSGYRVVVAVDGQEALDRTAQEKPDLVILDVVMPRVDGFEACREIKKAAAKDGEFVPVMLLSSRCEPSARAQGLRAGAEDFLGQPYDVDELRARIEGLLRTKRIVDDAMRSRLELENSSLHDRLTGLYNQRYLTQRLQEEYLRAARYNEPLSVMAIDFDQFEQVNSRYGRPVGDRLLSACARILNRICRQVDVVTRAGGDEFVVVLPNTHFAGSLVIAQRVSQDVSGAAIEEGATRVGCEVSVGVACYPNRDVSSANDLLRFAHLALGRAKAEGKGRICLYQHQGYLLQPE
jgi:diguanylate cyclase (GGDEF)-like protein